MHAHNLKDLKEQVFLVKAIYGVLLSPPEYPFRPPNTAGIPREARHSCPHTEGWYPFSWAQLAGDCAVTAAFSARPGCGRSATGHGEEETALLPTQVQAGKGQRERGRSHRFVLHR